MMSIARHGLVAVLAMAAAACHLDLAEAATLRGNEQNCQSLGYSFTNIAVFKAMGMSWVDAKVQLEAAIQESKVAADGLIKDADDEAFVMSAAWSVWNGALGLLSPDDVGRAVYAECMNQLKHKQKGRVEA